MQNNVGGDFLPFVSHIASGNASAAAGNVGSIIVHTTDQANGINTTTGQENGPVSLDWTSPSTGSFSISGKAWAPQTANDGRLQDYSLIINPGPSQQVLIGSTHIPELTNDFSNPLTFNLTNVSLNAGDVVALVVAEDATSPYGNFVGVDMTVAAPEPASLGCVGLGTLGLLIRRRISR